MSHSTIRTVLEPEDEHPHEPDDSPNYLDQFVAGWPTGPDVPRPARRDEVAS